MKYKTSLTATTLKSNENLIGIGSKQYTVNDDEFNLSLKILEFLLTEKDEDEILDKYSQTTDKSTDEIYVEYVLPEKMKYNLQYLIEFSIWGDFKVMIDTALAVLR